MRYLVLTQDSQQILRIPSDNLLSYYGLYPETMRYAMDLELKISNFVLTDLGMDTLLEEYFKRSLNEGSIPIGDGQFYIAETEETFKNTRVKLLMKWILNYIELSSQDFFAGKEKWHWEEIYVKDLGPVLLIKDRYIDYIQYIPGGLF